MRIDLHCHTKKTKKGDGEGRNVSPEVFKAKIDLADIKIVAITNHNAFDYSQYCVLRDQVQDICQVWPGVEIDVQGSREKDRFHLIVVCNPAEAEQFDEHTKHLFADEDIEICCLPLEKICIEYSKCDVIFIPHYHNKRPAISEEDREKLLRLVGDSSRIFIEPRDHRTLGVLTSNNFNAIIGSDVKDWCDYENCTFADLRLPVGNFSEFLLLSRRDIGVVKTLLHKKAPLCLVGKPHSSVNVQMEIYPDINVLFGPKGTGKTEILKSLYEAMIKEGHTCRKVFAAERNEDFSSLLSIKGMNRELSKLNAKACEKDFQFLRNWADQNPTEFMDYINWIETRGNSNNKSRMKITEAVYEAFTYTSEYNQHKNDRNSIAIVLDQIKNISLDLYFNENEKKQLQELLQRIEGRIIQKRKDDIINEEAELLVQHTIDAIKKIADRISDTVSRPSTAGFIAFAKQRIKLLKSINSILDSLKVPEKNEKILLGTLEDKGEIFINSKYRMLCEKSKTEEFSEYGIRQLKTIKKQLEDIANNVFSTDVVSLVDSFNEQCITTKIDSLQPFLGLSKQIVIEDGTEYHPSNGEIGILLLQQTLQEEADAYFLDEPELGMGNSFIDTDIRPLIMNLAKRRKYVIVATHNANIAVRSLPYVSVFRTHENGKYKTYIGNPFDDRLINTEDPQDIRSWTEESMHFLEGSREAFYERRDIYESKDN